MARKCRHCRAEIPPKAKSNHWQAAGFCNCDCMASHGLEKARQQQQRKADREAKAKRADMRKRKEALKSRADWAKEAQAAFNKWIRLRDAHLPCISCGRHHQGQYHAGHYRTVGANPELRFEPLNVHKQCAPCNNHKSGNIVEYRINLVSRIGQDAVDWLEGPHEPKRYTVDQLREIKREYTRKAREIERK